MDRSARTIQTDLAGSQGSAGVAATAQVDVDIQRNGTSIAIMRFAAGTTTATFIAASETVLEPGDVLSVVAPVTLMPRSRASASAWLERWYLDHYQLASSTNN